MVILSYKENVTILFPKQKVFNKPKVDIYHPSNLFLLMIVLINDPTQSPLISSSDTCSNLVVILWLCWMMEWFLYAAGLIYSVIWS